VCGQTKTKKFPPEKILLTERQLQEWGDRHWARDLFRDCLRSRTLIFSGFGSDEPQVRHTVLQIEEEFQNSECSNGRRPGSRQAKQRSCWDLPNAPFIAAYECNLTFNQVQILHSYAIAHNDSLAYCNIHKNVFTGADAKDLDPGIKDSCLSADVFWEKVYQAAFWQLFKKCCRLDTPFYAYLSSCIHPVDALLSDFTNWVAPAKAPFGRFPELLSLDNHLHVTTLTKWINCIRYSRTYCNPGAYLPLLEKPVLLPLVLLILLFVAGNRRKWEEINRMVCIENNLFILKIFADLPVFIVHDTSVLQKALGNKNVLLNNNISIGIVVSSKSVERAEIIHQKVDLQESNSARELNMKKRVTIYKIPFRDIFCWDSKVPSSVDATREKFFASLRAAKLIAANARRRIRGRAKKIL
jgi:hypothetical protein